MTRRDPQPENGDPAMGGSVGAPAAAMPAGAVPPETAPAGTPHHTPSSRARRRRGAATQALVAQHLAANGWPHATDAGAGRRGNDILGVPDLAIEVKARRSLDLPAWLRQAARHAGTDLPIVVHRPDGAGPATITEWPATLRLADLITLLRKAGYGGEPS